MGLDGPTAAASCFALHSHHHQQQQHAAGFPLFHEAIGGGGKPAGGHSPPMSEMMGGAQGQLVPEAAPGDDFPGDLNDIPLANLTNTALDGKVEVEPFFGFPPPSSVSSAHNHLLNNGCFPSNTPSTSSDSAPEHNSNGARPGGPGCARLVIRDPFDDDDPPDHPHPHHLNNQNVLPPSATNWFPPPPRAALDKEGRPLDGQTWMDQVRMAGGGEQRPLVPAPGNGAPAALLAQYAFHTPPMQRQRLESMYPPGTFSPTYFRTVLMPPPRNMLQMPPRYVMLPIRPAGKVPPGCPVPAVPVPVYCGPGGMPFAVLPNGAAIPLHPQIFAASAPGVPPPPMMGPPGPMAPNPPMTPQQQQSQLKQQLNNSGGSTTSSTATTATTASGKPKKESAKARKAREAAEKAANEQQQRQQQEAAMAAAASVGMPPPPPGRSPCEGFPPMMMGAPYGGVMAPGPPVMMAPVPQQQMCHQGPQQQEAIFKVPGRSPSSMKRASLPPPPFPASLLPMPEQRIQLSGQCHSCRQEITDQRKGIQCTAISQGCNRSFHWDCAELTPEAFQEFCKDPRLEWICRDCYAQKGSNCVFAI